MEYNNLMDSTQYDALGPIKGINYLYVFTVIPQLLDPQGYPLTIGPYTFLLATSFDHSLSPTLQIFKSICPAIHEEKVELQIQITTFNIQFKADLLTNLQAITYYT